MNRFEKLNHMVNTDMDIQLAPLSNITGVEIKGGNGYVTIGVSKDLAKDLIIGKKQFVGGLLLANKAQYDALDAVEDPAHAD